MMNLKGKQKRHLRGLGHHLSAVIQIGRSGLTQEVVAAIQTALTDHELIKIKVGQGTDIAAKTLADGAAKQTNSTVCQVLGGTFLLYRPHPKQPVIVLPK